MFKMDLFEAIQNRRSIRQYKKQDLPQGTVEKLVDAARMAPTAGNVQPYALVIVTEEKIKQQLSQAAFGQRNVQEVPVVIVVCADEKRAAEAYGDRGKTLYCIQDTAVVTQNILLTAHALGLGTCWVGAFKEGDVRKIVNAPKGMRPVAMIPVGYPNESPAQTSRRPESELVHKETF
jgi:nitroreductase